MPCDTLSPFLDDFRFFKDTGSSDKFDADYLSAAGFFGGVLAALLIIFAVLSSTFVRIIQKCIEIK